ncbi:MAG TPA: amino acid adenylation domain-containing protein, partial [Longimicrobiaceae bacterium]|nr:amino acid adenylation domain-containing protein [Longimicrobiaceae bacterium]
MPHQSVQELFSRTAARVPDHVAVARGELRVSYRELEERSNGIARFLLDAGVEKGTLVAILSGRAEETVAAILGVLKAGGVFVPLDPETPADRLRALLGQVEPGFFLVEPGLRGMLGDLVANARVACLGGELSAAACRTPERPEVVGGPDDMCYVYFTSGSTGTPKAIAGRLKGIDHFVRWETGTFGVGEGTRVSQFTSPAFDASLRDFFVPLCAGGTVCAPETRETLLDPAALVEWIDRERIELVHCVPSLFRSIVQQEPAPERFPALRHVLLAGEPLPPVDVRRWMDVFGERVELVNLYGPSETTMVKLFHRVTRADADRRSIPIGRPMEGARAVVVDERGRACPPGRVGEILIRTPYRTLGYYRQPELTAQVFVPNPFNPRQDPEDLVYRTGDLGRVLDDGSLEILGRRDHQIKLRGVRIEPGEVEHALRTHPAVRDVVVVDREDARGERLLCAYVVLAGPTPADALREHLSGRLPESMLPAVFVPLDRLPLTATGKVDRGALPAPAPAVHDFVAPRTATEEALARVWTETLGVERVGVHDSFFALGGYSLLAAQAVARVRDEFGIVLPLRALFDAPTVAGLAERVEAERAAAAGPAEAPIPRVPRDGAAPLPLSFAQERLWFLQQLDPADTTHNMAGALRLSGALDAAALEGALAGVVRRHETLRTRILTTPAGQAVQVIDPPAPVPLPLDDLAALPEGEREGEARRRIAAEVLRPFDLERGPLFRVRLLRLGEEEHVLAWTVHHIVSDGWSSGVLAREVSALYAVAVGAGAPELPELPVQYADYAAWQRERLPADAVERQLAWWREHLGGGLPNPELPRDRPAPAERTHAAAQEVVVLPRALGDRLAALGRAGDATPFMVLFAAFNALLHRYTGEDDLVAATAVAGRGFRELEGLIGFFVNTLALRTELSGDPTFRELVARVRATALAAFAHQEVPFQAVARALDPHGAGSEALTRVMFVHQHAAAGSELRLPGLEVRPFPVATGGESFDLTVWATDAPHGVLVQAQYPTDFYDAATVRRLLGHFATLLEAAAADPERRLSELPLLTAGEQAEREALNRTAAPYCDAPLHEQVEAQVRRTPDAVAVEWGGERLSYAELNRRANRLAHLLRARGVRPDGRVGLCLERSPEMAVAVLGILKAGAACVPLDPAYPRERLALMLEDAGAQLAVTSAALRDRLGSGVEALRVELDPAAPGATEDDPVSGASADTLLYVIFTSGSTGRPKAVAVPHRTLANLLAWQHAQPEYAVGARTLQFSTLSFDVAFQEIFSTWITGGTLVLIPEAVHRDAARWVPLLAAARVERLFCPFVALRQLAGWVDDGAPLPASLREAIPAGEQLQTTPALVRLFERLPGCRVHNMYGPSESHVVTAHTLEGDPSGWPALPPIGRPVWNTRVHVLDAHLQPVPVGIAGELYLGGDNLARGYLGRPDLTAERFLPDPFATAPGERLYRTGDRVRLRPDGAVDFLGRLDHQVKVRGFRVEPGEVEAVLALHPAVRGVVVTALPDAGAGRRLVAYTVPAEPVTVTELRAFLEERVPPYMVPSAFVFLERFPLLPSGKVDRRSLPDPEAARPALAQPYAPPRTPAEQVLAGVWSRLLGVDPVGIHDPFPELGGDSILAIQVVSQAHRAGMRITLQQLFELRTVAALAEVAAAVEPPAPGGERARSEEAGETVHPLSPMQQGILFHSLLAPDEAAYVEHVHCSYAGPFDAEAFRGAWGGLVERHPALRTTFAWEGVEAPLQVVHPHGELDLEVHDWRGRGEAARRDLAARVGAEDGRRYALDRLPLMHLSVFLLEDDSFDFVWSFHDIVLDGWSASAVLREFREGYDAAREGGAVELPEPLSFARYLEWLADQPLDAARAYWEGALAGLSAPTPLRSVLPAPAADESRGEAYRRHGLHLTPEATGRLLRGARRHGLTPNDLFQGAWGLLLSRYTGEREVLFGGVTAGRSAGPEGVETAVGVLVNTLPVRLRVRPEAPLSDWLTELQRSQREARAHEQIALYEIQRLAAAARFESILAFVNYPEDDAPGWRARRWSMQNVGYPLFVLARPGEQLYLEATFRTAELAGAAVERLLAHLATVLEGMGAALDGEAAVPLGRLPWLTAAEREHLLEEWNRTDAGLPEEGLAERFAAQAARTPEATAVVWGAERVSYRELERRAGLLARHLAEEGVGPETIVALLTERGLDFWTAALGVLLAGAAYLPLDPAHPPRRHRQVLEGSRTPLVLVAGALRPALEAAVAEMDAAARPCVRPLEDALAGPGPGGPLPAPPSPDGLAYVIFTSGSTGTPKGAMVEHRGMLNHLHAKVLELGLGRGDRVAQTASQCFDISVWQFLAPLLVGGEVHVLPDEVANDPAALAREVEARGITVLETVPSLMRTLVEELRSPGGAPVPLRALRWMIPTGEALPPELARDWLEAYPHVPLLNAYGPTECSDDVTHHPVHEPPAPGVRSVPIGRHLPNVRLYVVDAELDPVPEGVPGELLVGGVCVGRGYVHEPDRTADVFVPDPFGPTAGGRLYRTGDRVRLLPGGELEFLGRIDFQVKVRGFRIELGEIESVLAEHPAVRQAAVAARETGRGDRQLVAYLVAHPEGVPTAAELRAHVAASLPEYMVPAAWVELDALPLGANGKLDRRALPAPDEEPVRTGAVYIPPADGTEQGLAGIWAALLRTGPVGRGDNFFELGGDSILAIQVVARARQQGILLTPRDLLRHPTLAELAAAARPARRILAEQGPVTGEVRPTPIQRWLLEDPRPDRHHFNNAVLLRAEAPLSPAALARAAGALFRHHDALRLRFRHEPAGWRAWIDAPGGPAFAHVDLSGAAGTGEDAVRRAAAAMQRSLELEA